MYQREIFRIGSPSIPTYVYVQPYESSVSYQYPYQVVVQTDDRNDVMLSDTKAIRRELRQIKNDIGEIKRRQPSPTYYVVKQDHPNAACSICTSSSSKKHQKQYLQDPVYFCERCHSFVEERTHPTESNFRTKTPTSTYYDNYHRPPSCCSSLGHLNRRITLNELGQQFPSSSAPVQHARPWIPTASKNAYPNRRWNLSMPHPEP